VSEAQIAPKQVVGSRTSLAADADAYARGDGDLSAAVERRAMAERGRHPDEDSSDTPRSQPGLSRAARERLTTSMVIPRGTLRPTRLDRALKENVRSLL
jgi:hypothetical protein